MDRTMFKKLFLCLGLLGIAAQASDPQKRALMDATESECQELLANANWDDQSAFKSAAESGKKEVFDWLIQNFGIIFVKHNLPKLFHDAATSGSVEIMEYLFSMANEGERQELLNPTGGPSSNLADAAQNGQAKAVEWLLDRGADINNDILSDAATGQNVDVLKCIFNHVQDPEKRKELLTAGTLGLQTVLIDGALSGNKDVFVWLIEEAKEAKLDLDQYASETNEEGFNVFYWAVVGGNPEIVQVLFNSFPKDKCLEMINSKNKYGVSALSRSQRKGSNKIINRLLENFIAENSK